MIPSDQIHSIKKASPKRHGRWLKQLQKNEIFRESERVRMIHSEIFRYAYPKTWMSFGWKKRLLPELSSEGNPMDPQTKVTVFLAEFDSNEY